MFSFRKIINILVLISYVKMTIVSSFAMDSVVLPTLTTKLKVAPVFHHDGKLDRVTLNLIEKDRSAGTRKIIEEKTIYNPSLLPDPGQLPDLDMGWVCEGDTVVGFKWDLKDFGIVRVDFHGNVILDSAKQIDPTRAVKISGANAVLLHNCSYYHLITKSEGVMLMGSNTINNLVATLTNSKSGVLIHDGDEKDTLGHMTLNQGCLVNAAQPTIMDGAIWDLGGGDLNNLGTLNLQGRHDILRANLVDNKANISGGNLHIETKDLINDGAIRTQEMGAKVSGNFANIKTIETDQSLDLDVKGEGVNSGKLNSKGDINIDAGTDKFVNDGDIDAKTVLLSGVKNYGTINSVGGIILENGENHGSIRDERDFILILEDYKNKGTMAARHIMGDGHLSSTGVCIADLITVHYFSEMGGTLSGDNLVIGRAVKSFKTCPKTKIEVKTLAFEAAEGTILQSGKWSMQSLQSHRHLDVTGIVETEHLAPVNCKVTVQDNGILKSDQTHLDHAELISKGKVDLGPVTIQSSKILNRGTMRLILKSLDYESPIYALNNKGELITSVDVPEVGSEIYRWLGLRLKNTKGTLRLQGTYRVPEQDLYKIGTWNGKVIVEDTMILPGTTEAMDPKLFTNFAVNNLIIDGQGGQFSDIARTQDWTFADHIIFQNFERLWFFRSSLTINNPQFINIQSLHIQALFNIAKGSMSGRNIRTYSMGRSNDYLGDLKIAKGGMDLEVDQDVDIRFGKIEMRQDGRIKSKTGKILVGEEGAKADVKPAVMSSNHLNNPNYTKKYLNGAYVKSHGKLKLEAPESDVLVHYGQVLSVGGIEFVVKDLIKNLSGVIMSYGDITLRGKRYLQTRPDQGIFTANTFIQIPFIYDNIRYSLEISDPAQLSTFGQLICHLDSFKNHYGDVLVAKSLLWNGIEQSIKNGNSAIENLSRFTSLSGTLICALLLKYKKYETHTDRTPVTLATMKVGEDLVVVGGSVDNSGAINARTINFDLDSFASSCLGGRSTGHKFGTLQFDISQMIEDAKSDPAAAAFMGDTCLEGDEVKEALGGLNPDYFVYRLFSHAIGQSYLKLEDGRTVSGTDLIKFLQKNGHKIAEGLREQITALVWEHIEINKRLQPRLKLYISPDAINKKQGSGDVTGEKIHIKTKGDQTYSGGSVHAETTTILESESDIKASNTDISGDDGVAAKGKNIKAETLAHRIYHANGYTDIVKDDMRFTSKYGPALLVSFANLVLNGTFVSAASIGVKVGGYREFGTTELRSENTTYWKKHTFHEERTDHHATHLHAHGNNRPATDTPSGSAQAQAKPTAQTETKPQGPTPFNPNRTEYEGGVTVEDVDPEEDTPSARKPYHPHPEFIRTTEPSGYTWDEAAYKALPPLKSALKNPRRAQLKQGQRKTVRFEEPELTFTPEDILADSPETGKLDIETDGSSLDYGVVKEAAGDSTSRTHGTATQAAATSTYSRTDTKKSKRWGRTKKNETKHQSGRPNVCTTTAGNIATEEGDEGLNLYGSHIKAKRINLTSKQGRINLLTALGYDYVSMKKQSKDAAWQSTSQSVAYHENRQFCRFQTDEEEGLIIKAADGICVEFVVEKYSHTEATGGKKPKTTERSRLKDLPTAPGYEWLHEMDKRDDIIRIYVDERHDTMYMHQEGMSAIAKIVVSIIMSCISGGTLGILTAILTNLTINTIEARGDPVEGTKRTLSKEGLKSIGRSYVGQLVLGGDWGVAERATWLATLQSAFMESLNTTLSDYLGRSIIDGDWRVNARRIGLDLLTSTAARFGAKQIGGWRQGTILGGGFMDYVSHKIMHGALAAATSAATTRLDHVKGDDRRKRIMGAASGAMMAEAVSEYMMNGAIANVEAQLNASGHAPDSMAYADLRCQLMKAELQQIKMFAQLAVTASAEAMRFDLNAAMFAANNALENNFSQVFLSLYAFGKAQADEVDDEADQQAYGKARKKAIDAVTPELVKKYGAKIADYAGNVIFGPDGYADEMIKVIKETTGLNDVSPEIRQMLKEAASTTLKGVGVALDAPGEGTEYILLKAGVDRATARNVHRAINDFMMVAGAAGLAKSAAQFGARTASSSSKAATRTSVDGRAYSNTVMGHKGKEIHTVAGTNKPAIIKGRFYSGHALDRMQTRGLTSSVVEDIIKNGNISQGNRANRICHYDVTNNITIVTEKGNVVTVRFGKAS